MKSFVASLALVSASVASGAGPVNFDFKGVPLGTSLQEFRARPHPDGKPNTTVACTGEKVKMIGKTAFTVSETDVYNSDEKAAGVIKCVWVQSVDDPATYSTKGSVVSLALASSGYGARYYSFSFVPDPSDGSLRLYEIMAESNRNAFSSVVDALTSKYGKPTISTDQVQNKMGASFTQTTVLWSNANQSLVAQDRFAKIDDMVIIVTDERLAKPVKDAEAARKAAQPNPI